VIMEPSSEPEPEPEPEPSTFWRMNITWKSGAWLRLRSGCSSATSRSNGTSWCSYAPSVPSRTRPSSSRKVGSPERSVRSTSVLAKKPISSSTSRRVRPAMGLPTTTSSLPLYFDSSSWKAESSTMYSVAPSPRPSAWRRSSSARGRSNLSRAPRCDCTGGRGRSVGSSSSAGAPASRSFHQPTWRSSASPRSCSRCHTA
jgi:hypothetical protein